MTGRFLPPQLIYGGKTDQCHPKYKFPDNFHIIHSENHWANESLLALLLESLLESLLLESLLALLAFAIVYVHHFID